ncbi:hypothetical protein [Pyrobaculum neutrophilum]|uniref:hypothetical protein n=1 Tax=Pyrobaculum neutrophilum TaxID=70771 RepID=UPI0011E4EDA8|nr:hypothetical protein [Pyrobaculum neutrophilum]
MNDDFGLEVVIRSVCNEYVEKWKTEGKRYINVSSFEQMYAEDNVTPIEHEFTLRARLPVLNRENPAIPPAIPLLPLRILRRLAIYLTKTLEIQINWDHYEYWAWSAEVFRFFENSSPLLKALRERESIELLYLLFHLCLSRLGYTPQTREGVILNRVVDSVVNRHVKQIISNKFVIGIPIAAATFETVVKLLIELYGDDETKREIGGKKTLGRILSIFEEKVVPRLPQTLREDIQEMNKVIEGIWDIYGSNWRAILRNWRNEFMHGAKTWAPRAFAVYTNYISLLLWHSIPSGEYERMREKIIELRFYADIENYWGFYPPPV